MKHFIDDRDGIARYVRESTPEDVTEILTVADDVVSQKFLFSLRWDMERTYEPVIFNGSIDWLYQPGGDPEWIFAFNRMRFWICLGQAYAITKNETYAHTFAAQLCSWIDSVKRDDPACAKAWRSIEAGIRMEYWCKAMDYFDGSPAITKTVRTRFNESIAEHAEFIMGVWDAYNLMSNWGIMANHGLFIASVMLPQTERTHLWRAEAIRRLAKEIEIQVYDDGTHWEQSPMYHFEMIHCFLDVIILAKRNNIELPEIIERKTHDMCRAGLCLLKPDGNELSMGDSDEVDARNVITKAAYVFADGELKHLGYANVDFDSVWDLGLESIAGYRAINSTPPKGSVRILADSGNFQLRDSWTEKATYLHFHCGPLGAGHGHSDQLHIDLFANGEDILVDAGRYSYLVAAARFEFKNSTAHNTCTVDGKNFYVCSDSWECSKLNRAVNRTWAQKNGYTLFEGGHLGYCDIEGGVFVNRRVIAIGFDLFIIADEFHASGTHFYESRLHFGNSGKVSHEGTSIRYKSERNDAQVEFISSNPNVRAELIPSRLSRHYNLAENNTAALASFSGTGFASLFTVISLNNPVKTTLVPVHSNFKKRVFGSDAIEALTIVEKDKIHTIIVGHREYASPTDTFLADGCTGFGSIVIFDRTAGETEIGTVLQW